MLPDYETLAGAPFGALSYPPPLRCEIVLYQGDCEFLDGGGTAERDIIVARDFFERTNTCLRMR